MNRAGFEALADGVILLTILLVASTVSLSLAGERSSAPSDGAARYAEDTRVALFRTTLDGLAFSQDGEAVVLPNDTSVEAFLRLQVHLEGRGAGGLDFHAANSRIAGLANALVRPGWSYAIVGRIAAGAPLLRLPSGSVLPEEYAVSNWSYPALDASVADTVLSLFVWLSPHR